MEKTIVEEVPWHRGCPKCLKIKQSHPLSDSEICRKHSGFVLIILRTREPIYYAHSIREDVRRELQTVIEKNATKIQGTRCRREELLSAWRGKSGDKVLFP